MVSLVMAAFEAGEFVAGVDVGEGVGLVVEGDLGDAQRGVPLVDLPLAGGEEVAQRRVHRAPHQAEDGVGLVAGLRDGEVGAMLLERARRRATRSAGRNGESQGTVATRRALRVRKPALETGQRPGEPGDLVGDHAVAESGIGLRVAVGVHQDLVHLRGEPGDHVRDERPAAEGCEPLVDAAHAAALPAGEHQPGDFNHRGRRGRGPRADAPRQRNSRRARGRRAWRRVPAAGGPRPPRWPCEDSKVMRVPHANRSGGACRARTRSRAAVPRPSRSAPARA